MDDRATPEHAVGPEARAQTPKHPSDPVEPLHATGGADPSGTPFRPFGAEIEPVLYKACDGRLSHISFFRTDWQRGGALTGYAKWTDDHQQSHDVVVKLPVRPRERHWLCRLQPYPDVVPTLYAHGEELGHYDIAWVVMERMPHGPLGPAWNGSAFDLIVQAVARFYKAASNFPIDRESKEKEWSAILHYSRKHVGDVKDLPNAPRWKKALKAAQKKLPDWMAIWSDRPRDNWLHGDFHLANAMTRTPPPNGPAVLIDLAEVKVGCWVQDAVYLEHLFWSRRDRLGDRKICSMIAHELKHHNLSPGNNWADLAQVKRALLALATPANLEHEGNPHHVAAALEVLESLV
ncbi:MAG: phosphotransferase [Phycisphaera sp.]|nr:phosphotransferase [Phycisphaera sp.]